MSAPRWALALAALASCAPPLPDRSPARAVPLWPTPAIVPLAVAARSIAAQDDVTCASLGSSGITCWVWHEHYITEQVWTTPLPDAGRLALSARRICGRATDGAVRCADFDGAEERLVRNGQGPLLAGGDVVLSGDNGAVVERDGHVAWWSMALVHRPDPHTKVGGSLSEVPRHEARRVRGLSGVAEIAVGSAVAPRWRRGDPFWLARFQDGTVGYERCRAGHDRPTEALAWHRVAGLAQAISLAAGEGRGCAVSAAGQVSCFSIEPDVEPRAAVVPGLAGATSVALGRDHACALLSGGKVACWGGNEAGQLGDGTTRSREEARIIPGVEGAGELALGDRLSCALLAGGRVSCWGRTRGAWVPR